jgi:hypothetical protein
MLCYSCLLFHRRYDRLASNDFTPACMVVIVLISSGLIAIFWRLTLNRNQSALIHFIFGVTRANYADLESPGVKVFRESAQGLPSVGQGSGSTSRQKTLP